MRKVQMFTNKAEMELFMENNKDKIEIHGTFGSVTHIPYLDYTRKPEATPPADSLKKVGF
jgi:hypothetical protein